MRGTQHFLRLIGFSHDLENGGQVVAQHRMTWVPLHPVTQNRLGHFVVLADRRHNRSRPVPHGRQIVPLSHLAGPIQTPFRHFELFLPHRCDTPSGENARIAARAVGGSTECRLRLVEAAELLQAQGQIVQRAGLGPTNIDSAVEGTVRFRPIVLFRRDQAEVEMCRSFVTPQFHDAAKFPRGLFQHSGPVKRHS